MISVQIFVFCSILLLNYNKNEVGFLLEKCLERAKDNSPVFSNNMLLFLVSFFCFLFNFRGGNNALGRFSLVNLQGKTLWWRDKSFRAFRGGAAP